jgi:hypothetical protein
MEDTMYCFHDTNISTAKRSLIAHMRLVYIKAIPVLFLVLGVAYLFNPTPVFAKKKATVQPGPTTCVVLPKNSPKWKSQYNSGLLPIWKGAMLGQADLLYNQKSSNNDMEGSIEVLVYPINSPSITSGRAWNDQLSFLKGTGFQGNPELSSTSAPALGLSNVLSGSSLRWKDSGMGWFSVKGQASQNTVVIIRAHFTGAAQERQVRTMLSALRLHPSLLKDNSFKPQATPVSIPVFSVVVNPGRQGSIENAVCKATIINTGKVLTGNTDKNGKVSWTLPLTDVNKPIKIRLDSVDIVSKTIYHTDTDQNSMIYGTRSIKLVVNKQLQLNAANKFNLVYKQSVPLCRIQVNTAVWNPKTKVSEPRKCGIAIYNTKKFQLFVIRIIEFKQEGSVQILIPARSVHNSYTLLVKASQVTYAGIANFTAPDAGNDSTSVSILLGDQATHLAWIRDKILRLWTPIVGAKTAAKIANVNVKFTGEKVDYLNGTIRMPNNADFTVDSTATNVLHEWTHHINEVLFPNDAVEVDLRTGRQTSWAQSETLYSAWDEGRAHLIGQLMGQVLDTPNENEFVHEKAVNYLSNLKSNQGAGCEAVIATSLLCHYGSGNYAGPQEAIADIFAVHKQCIKDFGHEPYSIYDFMTAKQRLLKSQSDAKGANASLAKDRLENLAEIKDNYKMRGGLQLGGQLER